MSSRLIILSCAREMAKGMEDAGILPFIISAWSDAVARCVCKPVGTVDEARLVEDGLSKLFAEAVEHLRTVS